MEKIIGGLSNDVFKYNNLILKFYKHSNLNLNYEFEEFVQKKLYEKYHNVPKIYQSIIIDNKLVGRIEKYIESTNVTKEDFTSNICIYANLLKKIHNINITDINITEFDINIIDFDINITDFDINIIDFDIKNLPNFFTCLNNWTKILDNDNNDTHTYIFDDYRLIKEKAEEYISGLLMFLQHIGCKQVLCHNDFQQLNVLVDKENNYYVIDFEYASINYPYFDIANYFSECAFDNKAIKYDSSLYPNTEKRYQFYKEYFIDSPNILLFQEYDFIVLQFAPLVEYYWYIWSLLKYIQTKSIDYITYANIRKINFNNLINKYVKVNKVKLSTSNFAFCSTVICNK